MKAWALTVISGTAAARYDRALFKAKDGRLPAHQPRPQPTAAWPPENVALLEQYYDWLVSGGVSLQVIHVAYLPMAGHVLGFNLKPHPDLNLDADFQPALDYILAKNQSAEWNSIRRHALDKFRQFLRQQRGQPSLSRRQPLNLARYCAGLPDWLVEQLERYYHLLQAGWRQARQHEQTLSFWSEYTRLWRWLFERYPLTAIADLKRQHVLDYLDARLAAGYAAKTVNQDLRHLRGFLLFLQEQGMAIPTAVLRMHELPEPERLPRFLTDEQVRRLRDDFEQRVAQAQSTHQRRDALLDRAAFYLLWQGGLRLGEVEELRLDDLDVPGQKLMIRRGKGQKDRTVYITDAAVSALQAYLSVRGQGASDHVFLYRHKPVCKELIWARLKAAGARVGVKVTPHQLRHTCATQLLNAGCRVTSIQKLLGHRSLDSTLIYARVHDQTVADDYYAAMTRIEKSLNLSADAGAPPSPAKHAHALELVNRLAAPQLGRKARLDLVAQLRQVLNGRLPEPVAA